MRQVLGPGAMFDSFETAWTVARQAPLSIGFPRQKCWSGLSFSSPGDLPDPEIEPRSPVLADRPPGKPIDMLETPIYLGETMKGSMSEIQYNETNLPNGQSEETSRAEWGSPTQRKDPCSRQFANSDSQSSVIPTADAWAYRNTVLWGVLSSHCYSRVSTTQKNVEHCL